MNSVNTLLRTFFQEKTFGINFEMIVLENNNNNTNERLLLIS